MQIYFVYIRVLAAFGPKVKRQPKDSDRDTATQREKQRVLLATY